MPHVVPSPGRVLTLPDGDRGAPALEASGMACVAMPRLRRRGLEVVHQHPHLLPHATVAARSKTWSHCLRG